MLGFLAEANVVSLNSVSPAHRAALLSLNLIPIKQFNERRHPASLLPSLQQNLCYRLCLFIAFAHPKPFQIFLVLLDSLYFFNIKQICVLSIAYLIAWFLSYTFTSWNEFCIWKIKSCTWYFLFIINSISILLIIKIAMTYITRMRQKFANFFNLFFLF